jgi:hypothetical protein
MARERIPWAERIARGVARGLTPSQAAGKPKPGEVKASTVSGAILRGAARKASEAKQQREREKAAREREQRRPLAPTLPWSRATPGGTRDFRTTNRTLVIAALEEARAEGKDVLIGVASLDIEFGEYERGRSSPAQEGRVTEQRAYSGRIDPSTLLEFIDAYGDRGDREKLDAAISDFLEQRYNTYVGGIDAYIIKKFA